MSWGILWLITTVLLISHRYAWWKPGINARHPRILMYHMVSEHIKGAKFNKLRVIPAMFEYQVRWLKDHGWYFAFMSEIDHPELLPKKTVFLTFDDGFEDNYHNAFPVLQKYQAKATLFLVLDRFDRDWSMAKKSHHNSGELMRELKLSDSQVITMLDSGCWELGGHTLTHANLVRLSRNKRWDEINGCRTQLERQFGSRINSFAYPFGIYDDVDVELTMLAGFTSAVTTEEGINENLQTPFRLKRIKISGRDDRVGFWLRMRTGFRGWKR